MLRGVVMAFQSSHPSGNVSSAWTQTGKKRFQCLMIGCRICSFGNGKCSAIECGAQECGHRFRRQVDDLAAIHRFAQALMQCAAAMLHVDLVHYSASEDGGAVE